MAHISIYHPAAAAAAAPTPAPRLVRAAHEFEAQMMKELLKPLNSSDPLGGDEDDDTGSDSDSGNALGEFASEALGRALSEHGGLGIANKIIQELTQHGNKRAAAPVTGQTPFNTVMRSPT
jgi:Rod binding domain-containing protein